MDTEDITITVNPKQRELLQRLLDTGLWGFGMEEVVMRCMDKQLAYEAGQAAKNGAPVGERKRREW